MASLLLLTGAKAGSRLTLQGEQFTIGRGVGCDLVIDQTMIRGESPNRAENISRGHAIIWCLDGEYFIEDGDGRKPSRNHTQLNEQQVPYPGRTRLQDRDCIRICDFSCTFHLDTEGRVSVVASIDRESSSRSLQAQPAEKLRILLEISNSLSSTLDMDALLPQIVDHLFLLFRQADRGFIIQRDEAAGPLRVRCFKTRRPDEEIDSRFSVSIVRRCLDTVQAILGNDLPQQFPDSGSISGLPMHSLMCAPLWSPEGQALGAIQLDTRGKKPFTQDDLNLFWESQARRRLPCGTPASCKRRWPCSSGSATWPWLARWSLPFSLNSYPPSPDTSFIRIMSRPWKSAAITTTSFRNRAGA